MAIPDFRRIGQNEIIKDYYDQLLPIMKYACSSWNPDTLVIMAPWVASSSKQTTEYIGNLGKFSYMYHIESLLWLYLISRELVKMK